MEGTQLTITIHRDQPELRTIASSLANDNLEREQELFEQAVLRESSREDLE